MSAARQQTQDIVIPTAKSYLELYEPKRYKVYWGGRGSGKSTAVADYLITMAARVKHRVLCTRHKQNSLKESVHALLRSRIEEFGVPGYDIKRDEIVHQNGSQFIFAGLWNNIDSIKSMDAIDKCWVEEADSVPEESWAKLIPTIRKPRSEIIVTFNPTLKQDAAYQRFVLNPPKNARVRKTSWRDNPWFSDELRAEKDHDFIVDEDRARHIWEGELRTFADGAVYGTELRKVRKEGRLCPIPIPASAEIHTAWDLGRNDATAIWFFTEVGREIHMLDYLEGSLVGLDYYINEIKKRDYNYGNHYLPHDAAIKELSTNRSRVDYLREGGLSNIKVVPRIANINEGIEQTRQFIARCWFDSTRCERGFDALSNYQFAFNETNNAFGLSPMHNWASHGADAFRQAAQGYKPRRNIDLSRAKLDPRYFQ